MTDVEVVRRVNELADKEHRLERADSGGPLLGDEPERLRAVEVALDQCRDLLRERRDRRAGGGDPDDAAARSQATVEGNRQ